MEHIDENIYSVQGVEKKKKSIIPALLVLVVGIVMTWKSEELDLMFPSVEIGGALTAIGGMLAVYGLVLLISAIKTKKGIPYFAGKAMKRSETFYDSDKLQQLCEAVKEKKVDEIEKIPSSSTSSVILVTYSSRDGKLKAMQVLEYIPHQHVPATEMIVL